MLDLKKEQNWTWWVENKEVPVLSFLLPIPKILKADMMLLCLDSDVKMS